MPVSTGWSRPGRAACTAGMSSRWTCAAAGPAGGAGRAQGADLPGLHVRRRCGGFAARPGRPDLSPAHGRAVQPLPRPAVHAAGTLCRDRRARPTRTRSTRGCTSGASGRASAAGSMRHWPPPCMTTRSAWPSTSWPAPYLRAGRTMVGVMGGHIARRGTAVFEEAALLGRLLARSGRVVATGGGPGAMEAANLAPSSARPPSRTSGGPWPTSRRCRPSAPRCPPGRGRPRRSPNATRRVRRRWGFPRGSTVMNRRTSSPPTSPSTSRTPSGKPSCLNCATAASSSCRVPAAPSRRSSRTPARTTTPLRKPSLPMVLVGHEHWLRRFPAWPLLQSLASGRRMEGRIFLVDSGRRSP